MGLRSGITELQLVLKFVAVGAILVDVEVQDAGEPVQPAAAGARHYLVVQHLRPAVQRPELLQREAALPPSEAAVHCLNRDVTGRTGLRISARQHDARTGALQVTVKRLGQLEAADRSVELGI